MKAIKWMRRAEFFKRGKRMLWANWRNRCEIEDMARWFDRNYGRYCAFSQGNGIVDNRASLEKRFWHDVIHECEREAGVTG